MKRKYFLDELNFYLFLLVWSLTSPTLILSLNYSRVLEMIPYIAFQTLSLNSKSTSSKPSRRYLFIFLSFSKYLLNAYHRPNTLSSPGDTKMRKHCLFSGWVHSLKKKTDTKKERKKKKHIMMSACRQPKDCRRHSGYFASGSQERLHQGDDI